MKRKTGHCTAVRAIIAAIVLAGGGCEKVGTNEANKKNTCFDAYTQKNTPELKSDAGTRHVQLSVTPRSNWGEWEDEFNVAVIRELAKWNRGHTSDPFLILHIAHAPGERRRTGRSMLAAVLCTNPYSGEIRSCRSKNFYAAGAVSPSSFAQLVLSESLRATPTILRCDHDKKK